MHPPIIIAHIVTAFADAFFASKMLNSVLGKRQELKAITTLYYTLLPLLICVSNCFNINPYLKLLFYGLEILILSLFTHNGSILSKAFCVILILSIIQIGDIFVSGVVFAIMPNYNTLLEQDLCYLLIGVGIFYAYICIAIQIFRLFPNPQKNSLPTSQLLLLVIVPLIIATSIMLLQNYLKVINANTPVTYFVPAIIFLMLLFFMVFFFRSATKVQNYIREQSVFSRQLMQYEAQYSSLEDAYTALRELRHNWNNLLYVAKNMADAGDLGSFKNYIGDSAISSYENIVISGNSVADILLSGLMLRAKENSIDININAKLPDDLTINRADLCVLISNAFDNALEACSLIQTGEKSISVELSVKGIYLYFALKNTIGNPPKYVNGKYLSSKPDKEYHGLGLSSIERIAEKYDGNLTVEHNDMYFSLQCILALQ